MFENRIANWFRHFGQGEARELEEMDEVAQLEA